MPAVAAAQVHKRMPKHPTLLVLAASPYQIPFIAAGKRLGCRVLTADNKPENPGHALADESFICDTTDIDGLVALARRQKVDGVVAAATDIALDAAAAIASDLGLPGPSVECAQVLTRKLTFRQLQSQLGLPHPLWSGTLDGHHVAPPWIVKPNRASGSKGVAIVNDISKLDEAWQAAGRESADKCAIIESCLPGLQGTIEGVMHDGRIAASLVTDRLTVALPAAATRGHRTPGSLAPSSHADLHQQVERVFERMSYRSGPFDGDFLIREDGRCVLIELTPRAGGNSLVQLLKHAAGFDMTEYVVMSALGISRPTAAFEVLPAAVEILGVERNGTLQYDEDAVAQLATEPGIRHIQMDMPAGAPVRAFIDGRHRVGEIIATADTPEAVHAIVENARKRIDLRVV